MSNIERMREGYARYSARDFSFVDELFAEDIDWRVPVGEPMRGRQQVQAFFDGLAEQFASHTITLDDAVEDGDRLICFVHHTLTRPDGEVGTVDAVHDWRFRDGQIASLREVADTLAFAQIAGLVPQAA